MAGNQDTNPATPMNNESPVKIYNAVNVVKLSKINPMNGIEKSHLKVMLNRKMIYGGC